MTEKEKKQIQRNDNRVEKRSIFNEGIKKIVPITSKQNEPKPPAKKD